MEKLDFEKKLKEMEKPEIHNLQHEDILSKAIINAKDKSVVSWWWLSVPVFIIAMLLMKSIFMPGTSLLTNMHDLENNQKYISLVFFLISPLVLIIINSASIRKIHFLSGSPKFFGFLEVIWLNILVIAFCILILIIYSL